MTIDRENLKALAEAQPIQDWRRTSGRKPHMPGQRLIYGVEGPEGVSDYEDWGFTGKAAEYIAAACPATMLALLAEIEQLRESHEQVCTNYNRVSFVAEERGKERDQLKTENEALRKDAENWQTVRRAMDQLKSDEQGAAIWSACSRILISLVSDLNSARSVVTEEGVTKDGAEIGDWRVTVERLAMTKEESHD